MSEVNSLRDVLLSVLKHEKQVLKGLSTIMNHLQKLEERVSKAELSKCQESKIRKWFFRRQQVDNLELDKSLLQPLLCADEIWADLGDKE